MGDIDKLKNRLEVLQFKDDSASLHEFADTKEKLADLLVHEHDFWRQMAEQFWLVDGDLNTRIFHLAVNQMSRVNRLVKLNGDDGIWYDDFDVICGVVKAYF